jgi:hypothetical protein
LCASGGLLFALGSAVTPEAARASDTPSAGMVLALVGVVGCGVAAHRLLTRSTAATPFFRFVRVIFAASVPALAYAFWFVARTSGLNVRHLPVLLFLPMVWLALKRASATLTFWFPQESARAGIREDTLAPGRNWRTVAWLTAYALFWTAVVGTPE